LTVLVDTSVWIRSAIGRSPYDVELALLLSGERVVAHELVYGELLIGDLGGRAKMLRSYELIPRLDRVPHSVVVDFARANRLHGRGVSWIDVHLLASTIASRCLLWTADSSLATIASGLGVAYR